MAVIQQREGKGGIMYANITFSWFTPDQTVSWANGLKWNYQERENIQRSFITSLNSCVKTTLTSLICSLLHNGASRKSPFKRTIFIRAFEKRHQRRGLSLLAELKVRLTTLSFFLSFFSSWRERNNWLLRSRRDHRLFLSVVYHQINLWLEHYAHLLFP